MFNGPYDHLHLALAAHQYLAISQSRKRTTPNRIILFYRILNEPFLLVLFGDESPEYTKVPISSSKFSFLLVCIVSVEFRIVFPSMIIKISARIATISNIFSNIVKDVKFPDASSPMLFALCPK